MTQGLKLKRKDLDLLAQEMDDDDGGTVDAAEFKAFLQNGTPIATRILAAGRFTEACTAMFIGLIDPDLSPLEAISRDSLTLESWQKLHPKLKMKKSEHENALTELGITKQKNADFDKFSAWISGKGRPKIGIKIKTEMMNAILAEMAREAAMKEARAAKDLDAQKEAHPLDGWTADYLQFSMWMNSGSAIAQNLNHAAAQLQWPEPVLEDPHPPLDDEVIRYIFTAMDWDDHLKIGASTLITLKMETGAALDGGEMDRILGELVTDEHDLFDYKAFAAWMNGETELAKKVRQAAAMEKRKTMQDRGAAAAAALGKVGAMGMASGKVGAKVAGQGLAATGGLLKRGGAPLARAGLKGTFGATKLVPMPSCTLICFRSLSSRRTRSFVS
jgi:hypothetical protein